MPALVRTVLIVIGSAILLFAGLCIYPVIIPRIVTRAVAPDGTEMCVIQNFNWGPELFTTRFVYRKPGAPWGEFYYDHQDDLWASSRVSIDPAAQTAVFFRDGARAITFAWLTETYTLHRRNSTETGAQSTHPADWTPPGN